MTIDLAMDGQKMRDFIPEDKEVKLTQISCVNQTYYVVIYQRNVSSYLFLPLLFLTGAPIGVGHGRDLHLLRGRHTTDSDRVRLYRRSVNLRQRGPISLPRQNVRVQHT